MQLAELLEAMMIVSFGISWPLSIIRSYRSRSTKGKSVLFSFFILFGYICGISSKLMTHNHNLAFYFYILNITMVSIDICLYFRNLRLEKQLEKGTYKQRRPRRFKVTYPKERDIVSVAFRDRVFQRSLNDNIIYPRISKSFIYDNMACQHGKGPDKARDRLKCFLQRYYRKHGIEGYVLKCDIKGYYPNMSHKVVRDCFKKVIDGWTYEQALTVLDGQYDGETGYNPGSQMIQIAGIGILNSMDHFVKETLHIEYYMRYMDDFILIHHDKQYLLECKARLAQMLMSLDCQFNTKKTNVTPLSDGIEFLGFHFRLTETGKVVMTLNSKNVKHERKKLKKLVGLAKKGKRTKEKVDECYESWKNHASKGDSYKLLQRMDRYYRDLWRNTENDVRG